jgi:hypothetical protein
LHPGNDASVGGVQVLWHWVKSHADPVQVAFPVAPVNPAATQVIVDALQTPPLGKFPAAHPQSPSPVVGQYAHVVDWFVPPRLYAALHEEIVHLAGTLFADHATAAQLSIPAAIVFVHAAHLAAAL